MLQMRILLLLLPSTCVYCRVHDQEHVDIKQNTRAGSASFEDSTRLSRVEACRSKATMSTLEQQAQKIVSADGCLSYGLQPERSTSLITLALAVSRLMFDTEIAVLFLGPTELHIFFLLSVILLFTLHRSDWSDLNFISNE